MQAGVEKEEEKSSQPGFPHSVSALTFPQANQK